MPDEVKNTDGSAATVTATETPAEKKATSTASDTAGPKGLESRIDGLTAERNREREKREALEQQLEDEREKNKSEQQKLLDAHTKEAVEAWKKEHHEPLATSAANYEAYFQRKLEAMTEQVKEESRPQVGHLSTFDQMQVYESILVAAGDKKPDSIGASVNPQGDAPPSQVKWSEFTAWQNMATTDIEQYEKLKPHMWAARREGRIIDG